MIDRAEMFPPILKADPSFEPRWQAFVTEYADELDLPLYLACDQLAEHLIERQRRRDTEGFADVFAVVERWHLEGDGYVSEAASIGLLESLQNQLGGNDRAKVTKGVRAADFEPWFGPETRRWWEKLYRFWEGEIGARKLDT